MSTINTTIRDNLAEDWGLVTIDEIGSAALGIRDLNNYGVCLSCGEVVIEGVEPDAENYPCDYCEENEVFGLMRWIEGGGLDQTIER